jgi:uncharacterized protein
MRWGTAVTGPSILVLAKAPEPGRVKTRLCPPLTHAQAADLAAAALLDSIAAATGVPGARPVAVLTGLLERAARHAALTAALRGVDVVPQTGDSLGERIAAAHRDGAAGRRTLQIGMDTPQVCAALLSAADDALTAPGVDAVLGLARDGGWWALGLRDPAGAELIVDVPTSRDDTGARTLAALRAGGLRVALLPAVSDVDTAADVAAVAAAAPGSLFAAAVAALPAGALLRHAR